MISLKTIGAAFVALYPCLSCAFGHLGSVGEVSKLNRIVENVGVNPLLDSLEQQKRSFAKETKMLSKQAHSQQVQDRLMEIRESNEIVTGAQHIIKETQEPQKNEPLSSSQYQYRLEEYFETIRTTKNPSWVICSSYPWKASDKYGWMDYIDPIANNISPMFSGVGVFTRYSQGSDGQLIFGGDYGGTGFLISTSLVMTNKHVLKKYAYQDTAGWHFLFGQQLHISFPIEYSRCKKKTETKEVKVVGIRHVDRGDLDFAILEIEDTAELAPRVLTLAEKFSLGPSARVAAIGYPQRPRPCEPNEDFDPEDPCTFLRNPQIDEFFREPDKSKLDSPEFPVERLSPGFIMRDPTASPTNFLYDSSTWGGSSGSPIISLVDGKVVGIHFKAVRGDIENDGYNKGLKMETVVAKLKQEGIFK